MQQKRPWAESVGVLISNAGGDTEENPSVVRMDRPAYLHCQQSQAPWMDKPNERGVSENYNENLRAAIDQAMTAPAYPPARPEYPEIDEALEAAAIQ